MLLFFWKLFKFWEIAALQRISPRVAAGFVQRLWSGTVHLQVLYLKSGGSPLGRVLHSPYYTLSIENRLSHMN